MGSFVRQQNVIADHSSSVWTVGVVIGQSAMVSESQKGKSSERKRDVEWWWTANFYFILFYYNYNYTYYTYVCIYINWKWPEYRSVWTLLGLTDQQKRWKLTLINYFHKLANWSWFSWLAWFAHISWSSLLDRSAILIYMLTCFIFLFCVS